MKTFDAETLLAKHMQLGRYPADSLTRRDVILTLQDGNIEDVNTRITTAIFKYVDHSKFKTDPNTACTELTMLVINHATQADLPTEDASS